LGQRHGSHRDRHETDFFVAHDRQNGRGYETANRDAQQDDADTTALIRPAHTIPAFYLPTKRRELGEPVCRAISHCCVRTHVSTKIMKRDWVSILVIGLEIVIILAAAALAYAVFQIN
jgi:hypothetical protein